jgi:hypothetical protein
MKCRAPARQPGALHWLSIKCIEGNLRFDFSENILWPQAVRMPLQQLKRKLQQRDAAIGCLRLIHEFCPAFSTSSRGLPCHAISGFVKNVADRGTKTLTIVPNPVTYGTTRSLRALVRTACLKSGASGGARGRNCQSALGRLWGTGRPAKGPVCREPA